MSFNLIDAAKNLLPNDLVSKTASSLGESESGIQKALNGAIPAVVSGLIGQSSSSGASGILDLIKNAAGSGLLNNITGMLGGGGSGATGIGATVMGWLRSLFGSKLESITSLLSGFAGIKPSSANTVLGMAALPVLGSVGKYARENNLDASGLGSFLQSQKSFLSNAIPPGLNLTGALGFANLGDIGNKVSRGISNTSEYAEETVKKTSSSWIWILLLLIAAILIWLFASKGCNKESADTTVPVDTTQTTVTTPPADLNTGKHTGRVDTTTGDYIYDVGEMITIELPNSGGQLNVGRFSTEARLVEFLKDQNAKLDSVSGNWFDFTNVRFATNTANLTAESSTQLKNLAMIIKAFPMAKFKIGGYTDNTGTASVNKSLSQKRATAVANEIIKQGATKMQITGAEGYGDQYPVGDNSTPEGKAMNRRVSVNVKAK